MLKVDTSKKQIPIKQILIKNQDSTLIKILSVSIECK